MRVTQDLYSFGEIIAHAHCSVDEKKSIYIPCVPHKNDCKKKVGSHSMKQKDTSIIIVRNVCMLTKHPWLFNFSSRGHDRQSSEQNNRNLISLHNMVRTINMHTDLQISSCWEHISTWNMLSKDTAIFQIEFSGENFIHPKLV
jgi:hypothetical protein